MTNPRRLGWVVVSCCLAAGAYGQHPFPIADTVTQPLVPSGISELDVKLDGELAFLFKDEDGTDAAHFLGGFALTHADVEAHSLASREAVVWISHRAYQGKPYRHIEMLLWGDAEIREVGGTDTSGPALFVTLNTFGDIKLDADDLAFQSSADRDVYREGNTIRKALADANLRPSDADVSLGVLDTSGLGSDEGKPKPRPPLVFQCRDFRRSSRDDRKVITAIGGAYLSRGATDSQGFLEIRADSVVVFEPPSTLPEGSEEARQAGLGSDPAASAPAGRRRGRNDDPDRQTMAGPFGEVAVDGVYLEGDVLMSQGPVAVRASRLYYDFARERALILDAVVHAEIAGRDVPIYLRANEIRQLSTSQFSADNAVVSTSEFHTPHYHIGAGRVELINRTPPEPTGDRGAIRAGSFRIHDATFNIEGRRVGWWPYAKGSIDTSETAIKSLRAGYSGDWGLELETDWHLFNVLGLERPDGFTSNLSIDYFSERGPAFGVDLDYERDTYFGLLKTYLLFDDDVDNLAQDRADPAQHDVRGRALIRHRHYLEDDWQLSLELSYISDGTFLEEFFEREFENEKEQETLIGLKKQRDNWAFTANYQTRILDFYTQTERLPDFAFHLAGQSIADKATWHSENRAGIVRYRTAHTRTFREFLAALRDDRPVLRSSGAVMRGDTRQEIGLPLDAGPLRLVPFVTGRATAWDDSPDEGNLTRIFGSVGVRGSMYLWKSFPDVKSELFDIDGVRHIIKPDFTAWASTSNVDSEEQFLFDETVEGIDDVHGVAVGVRQRWQTKRGAGDTRRTVDFLTLDMELGFFDDAPGRSVTNGYTSFTRPENSIARNYFNAAIAWRVNDRTALLTELNYDLNDGEVDVFNLSLAVERSPRLSYLVGFRYIDETRSNLLAFDLNYRMSEKHILAVRELFDLERGRTHDFTIALIRKFPRWYGALSFELDDVEDDFGISVSIWPEGLPSAAIGSRRFTGLAETTQLEND